MTEVNPPSYVNYAAFATVTTLAIGTGVLVFGAATTASTVAMVAYSIFAIAGAAATGAGITAWLHKDSTNISKYFETYTSHLGIGMAVAFTFVSQTLVQALVAGLAQGVTKAVSRKIAGPDHTTEVTHKHA
jgi:hypothetical protein